MNPDDKDAKYPTASDDGREGKSPVADAERDERPMPDNGLLEALRHELKKQELAAYEPTREELRDAEADASYWRGRAKERRRENLRAKAQSAVCMSAESLLAELADKPREWLLDRLAELQQIARRLPGGVQVAHRNLEARSLDDVPTDEIRSQVADLELAIQAEQDSSQ